MKKLILVILLLVLAVGVVGAVNCDGNQECIDLESEINELAKEVSIRSEANEKNADEMRSLQARVRGLQGQISQAEKEMEELEEGVRIREEKAAVQYEVLAVKTREFYKNLRSKSVLSFLFSSLDAGSINRELAYRFQTQDQDRQIILQISKEIIGIEKDKAELEKKKIYLSGLSSVLDKQAKFLEGEVVGVSKYIGSLEGKIAALSAKQQSILGQRLASLNLPTSLGAGPLYCTDDRNLNPGFSPAFAFYTFGIPHRVGMSQYGAYGRANAGQTYDEILRAYYNFDGYEDKGTTTIRVNNGNGINQGSVIWSGSLEDYVKRIYEIPASWPVASLQAQAIAARSYVLAVTSNGVNSICANQWCQVFKSDSKGGDWEGAVNATAGKVMVSGGEIITAWYASTAGGYTFTNADVWGGSQRSWTKRLRDTNGDVSNFGDLLNKAYDRESPCFYAAQGWRNEYGKSAWLKSSEVADLVNVLMLVGADSSSADHLYQTDKPHPFNGEIWNEERVKQELRNKNITPFSSVSSVSIGADFGIGKTTNVTISGDGGSKSFSGDEFRNYFNLRALANIQIVGPLFNIEKK